MGRLDVTPASSPWQRAGDYFRCSEGSGLKRVSVPLSHAVRAAATSVLLALCVGPERSLGRPLRVREGAARRTPLARGGARGGGQDVPSSLVLVAHGPVVPLPSLISGLTSSWPSGKDCLYVGSSRSPSPTLQSRSGDVSRVRGSQRAENVRLVLGGGLGPRQPLTW